MGFGSAEFFYRLSFVIFTKSAKRSIRNSNMDFGPQQIGKWLIAIGIAVAKMVGLALVFVLGVQAGFGRAITDESVAI